jgi:LysR family transcriptional activator of nhaA
MTSLNFLHLRSFWMTASAGSLRIASERWHVSQPSLSEQIKLLEQSLGQELFRKVSGRLVLTEAGRRAFDYANEIFALGRELTESLTPNPQARPLSIAVGVTDSMPKLLAWSFMRPALQIGRPVRLVCRESKAEDLLAQLTAYRLDIVLCDEPAPSHSSVPVFAQPMAESSVSFLGVPALAKKFRKNFPLSLTGAPLLMPALGTAMRTALEKWLHDRALVPQMVVECEDSAMLKAAALDALGLVPVPTIEIDDVRKRYGLELIGEAPGCKMHYFAITAARKITNPAISAILQRKL